MTNTSLPPLWLTVHQLAQLDLDAPLPLGMEGAIGVRWPTPAPQEQCLAHAIEASQYAVRRDESTVPLPAQVLWLGDTVAVRCRECATETA